MTMLLAAVHESVVGPQLTGEVVRRAEMTP